MLRDIFVGCFLAACLLSLKVYTCDNAVSYWETTCDFPELIVGYPNLAVSDKNCNGKFDKNLWKSQPNIYYPKAKEGETYTILCLDPDAPNHAKGFYYLHMVLANAEGSDLAKGDLSKATILSPYYGPNPPKDSGVHHYMFVAYKHTDPKSKITEVIQNRGQFNLEEWLSSTAKEGTELIGPAAGIQFTAEY